MTLKKAIFVIVAVLALHALGIVWLYDVWMQYDMAMHFLGGVAMGCLALALEETRGERREASWRRAVWILGFVAIIGIGWEWFEFVCDNYLPFIRETFGPAQASIGDTMADFFFDLLGGAMVVFWKKV